MLKQITDETEEHDDRFDAAGRWYVELRRDDVDMETWDAFLEWERDPANAAAFRAVEQGLGALKPREAAPANDITPAAAHVEIRQTRLGPRRWAIGALAACLTVGLALAVLAAVQLRPETQLYATAVGERQTVMLEDGSQLTLNTSSAVEIAYSGQRRLVRQTRGQVYFEVAHGDARPFQVLTDDTLTTATGTAFDVFIRPDETAITLIEGGVTIGRARDGLLAAFTGPAAAGEVMALSPGQQARMGTRGAAQIAAVDTAALTLWRGGFVQFTDATLAEAIRELNRYSAVRLRVTDPELASERLSGSFPTGDPEGFAATLEFYLPIRVIRSADTILIAPQRETSASSGG